MVLRTFCTATVPRMPNLVGNTKVTIDPSENVKNIINSVNMAQENQSTKLGSENAPKIKTVVANPKKRLIDLSDDDEVKELQELKTKAQKKIEDQVFHKKEKGWWVHVEHFMNLVKKGCIDMKKDSRYLKSIFSGNLLFESRYTAYELRERRRISKDILKFIPFFGMLIIPGGEIFIPLYVGIFPNATPNQLLTDSEKGIKVGEKVAKQDAGHNYLKNHLPKFINVIGLDSLHYQRTVDKFEKSEGLDKEKYFYTAQCFSSQLNSFMENGDHSEENVKNI